MRILMIILLIMNSDTPTFETAAQIGIRIQLPASAVLRLRRMKKIPGIRMGFRTIRFDPVAVLAALENARR